MHSVLPLPKWVMQNYSKLWLSFSNKKFTHDEAAKAISEGKQSTSLLLSQLKRAGWLSVELDPEDGRKRIYKIISPQDAVRRMAR